jgi:hypothetical protein
MTALNYNAGHTHQKRRLFCRGVAGKGHLACCACYTAGVQCTIYSHRCTGEGPNKATGAAYTQVAIVDVPNEEEMEEELVVRSPPCDWLKSHIQFCFPKYFTISKCLESSVQTPLCGRGGGDSLIQLYGTFPSTATMASPPMVLLPRGWQQARGPHTGPTYAHCQLGPRVTWNGSLLAAPVGKA